MKQLPTDPQSRLRPPAPGFQPEALWSALGRLDRMLVRANTAFAAASTASSTPPAPTDLYLGTYIVAADARRLIRRRPNDTGLVGADAGMAAPVPYEARFLWLQQVFGLDAIDLDILLITLAPEVDLRYELQFAHLQGQAMPRPSTVDLVLNLLCASREAKLLARSHFTPQSALFRNRLLQLTGSSGALPTPLLAQSVTLEESVVHFLLGEPWLDARLRSFARRELPAAEPGMRADTLAQLMSAELASGAAHFSLEGPTAADQDAALASLAARLQMPILSVALGKAAEPAGEFANTLQLLFREAALLGAILYLSGRESLPDQQQAILADSIAACAGTVLVMAGTGPCGPRFRTMASLAVAPASFADRRKLWASQIGAHGFELEPNGIDELASRYRLSEAQIKGALTRVERQAALHKAKPGQEQLAEAARLQMVSDPGPLAHKLSPAHDWDDLVLPASQFAMLKEFCSQARYRHLVYDDWGFDRKLTNGKGLSALFTGPPGTGKTMAVEVIANDLGLEVFKIDLSQVVSKYIGETEKALDRLFSEARAGNAILFFDECDALFGKRNIAQDAHDRYANIEVAYLLQKLEEYDGVSILATNLRQNLDVAFTRRLSFIVEFPFPDEQSRRRLWESVWPPQVPRSKELDLDYMATQFKLSGGAVKNIALAAAFLAARSGAELRTEHLLWATRGEIEKSGQRLAPSEFGRYAGQVAALAGEGAT